MMCIWNQKNVLYFNFNVNFNEFKIRGQTSPQIFSNFIVNIEWFLLLLSGLHPQEMTDDFILNFV